MSSYVCPGFGGMVVFNKTYTDAQGVERCTTPVFKEEYLKSLSIGEEENIFSMGDYCAKTYRNGMMEVIAFDEWYDFYASLQEEWFSNVELRQNVTLHNDTLRIHPGIEIKGPPIRLSASSRASSSKSVPAMYTVQTYEGGILRSYSTNVLEGIVADSNILSVIRNRTLSMNVSDYPLCVALEVKKAKESFLYSEPFRCRNNSGWDVFMCRHDAYRSCKSKRGKLIGQYFGDASGKCSKKYSVNILRREESPYGRPCRDNYISESSKCIECTGQWSSWTEWSSVCDWAYRIRSRHSVKNPDADCSLPIAPCCREWQETTKETCKNFALGTSVNLAKGECTAGTKQQDVSGGYYCRCEYGLTGTLCEIRVKCPSFPCLHGSCRDEKCQCSAGYTGILCEKFASCKDLDCGKENDCIIPKHVPLCYCRWYPDVQELHKNCVIGGNACFSSPCKHGSTCLQDNYGYLCLCSGGFTGKHCTVEFTSCDDRPCRNGAPCHMENDKFVCSCRWPFTGRACELDVSDCGKYLRCQNGGKHAPSPLGCRCICAPGYTGLACEKRADLCDSQNPCMNGGVCYRTEHGSKCVCLYQYAGKRCQRTDVQKEKLIKQILASRVKSRTWKVVLVSLALVAACALIRWNTWQRESTPDVEENGSSKSSRTKEKAKKGHPRKSIFHLMQMRALSWAPTKRPTGAAVQKAKTESSKSERKHARRFSALLRGKR